MTKSPRSGHDAPQVIECTVNALAFGGHGIARTPFGVVFVPGTAPGDVVRIRLSRSRKHFFEGELLAVLEPSPARRSPPCPYLPECGGCTWQHVRREVQIGQKLENLKRELHRAGVVSGSILPTLACPEWSYRHRIRLRVDDGHRLGFYQYRSHSLVEIAHCRIANDAVNEHLAAARDWLARTRTQIRRLEIASAEPGLRPDGDRPQPVVFLGNAQGNCRDEDRVHEALLERTPSVRGVLLFGQGWRRSFGDPTISLRLPTGQTLRTRGGFTQINPEANDDLVTTVTRFASVRPDDRVLDLYAGAGNFTLPLALEAREVIAVESDPHALADARRNAGAEGVRNGRFLRQGAAAAVRAFARAGERHDVVVLDPPRSGAADVATKLPALEPRTIVYVSCNPSTLARDLRTLVAAGYRAAEIQPIDLFPQTHHLETVTRLARE